VRLRDAEQGERCRFYENAVDWNATGVSGVTGPTGPCSILVNGGGGGFLVTVSDNGKRGRRRHDVDDEHRS